MTMINPFSLIFQATVIFASCVYVLGLKTKIRYVFLGAAATVAVGCVGIAADSLVLRFLSMNFGVFATLIVCCKRDLFSKVLAWILPALTNTVFIDIPLSYYMKNKYHQSQVHNPAIYSLSEVLIANLAFLVCMVVTTFLTRMVIQKIQSKGRVRFAIFYLVQLIVFILFYFQIQQTITVVNFKAMLKIYAPMILYFIALSSTIMFFIAMQKNETLTEYNRLLMRLQQDREDYYCALTYNIDTIKKYRHDIANHIQNISVLIERNEMQTAKEYFGKLQEQYDETKLDVYSGDPMLDAVLYSKNVTAQIQGVTMDVSVPPDLQLGSGKIPMVGIVANLLDNALEACSVLDDERDRRVSVTIAPVGDRIRIVVVNPYSEEKQATVKKDGAYEHGLGLRIVRNFCESHQGEFNTSKDEKVFCACAELESKATDE